MNARVVFSALTLILLTCAVPARSQTVGVRVGVSAEPDQFYLGAHVETEPFADALRFRPNIEVGFGNDVTLTALNFELAYHFPRRNRWNLYAGGGPALNIYRVRGNGDAEPGFNVLLGAQHQGGFFAEIKGGGIDSPNLKFGIGYVFAR